MSPAEPPSNAFNDGDIAMMVMATTFVMLQTPAMGIAQAGMIRRKNALSMLMQTLTGMSVGSILWYIIGFALTFGDSAGGFIGNPAGTYGPCFRGIPVGAPISTHVATADTIPGILMAVFQMMFALMVPVIVTGAWAERMEFGAFLVFIVLWPLLVYYPLAHWVWNTGGWMAKWGVKDFAGGITIHTSTGMAALAVVTSLQVRKGHASMKQQHHNLPLSALGAALIWGGWYSFNGGSAYKANAQAVLALLNTHLSACTGAFTWTVLEFVSGCSRTASGSGWIAGKWQLSATISGAFAGLAGVTAGSGFMPSQAAAVIGIVAATAGFFTVRWKERVGLDDVLDVMALQGSPGIVGSIFVGIASDSTSCGQFKDGSPCPGPWDGAAFGGGWSHLWVQLACTATASAWSFCWTLVIMWVIRRTVGVDVSPEAEEKGLDVCQIGEMAYDHDIAGTGDVVRHMQDDTATERLCEAAAAGSMVRVQRLLLQGGARADAVDYDQRSPAHLAAANGHLRVLQELQRFGCRMDVRDRWRNTPLKEAIDNGHDDVIQWLRAQGHVVEETTAQEALCDAAASGDAEATSRLISAGAHPNAADYDRRTPLHLAASEGHEQVLRVLLDGGGDARAADRWGGTPLDDARRGRHAACADLLLAALAKQRPGTDASVEQHPEQGFAYTAHNDSNTDRPELGTGTGTGTSTGAAATAPAPPSGGTPRGTGYVKSFAGDAGARELCDAASSANVREVRRLLQKRADPTKGDYDGRTALHLAACAGHAEVLRAVLNALPALNVNVLDRWNQTPLFEALSHGHQEAAALLRAAGGVVMDKKQGQALCAAAAKGDIAALRAMQEGGADVSTADYDGRTALHLASAEGKIEVVQWLLVEAHVSPNPLDRWGGTPLRDAIRNRQANVAKVLRDAGGTESGNAAAAQRTVTAVAGESGGAGITRPPSSSGAGARRRANNQGQKGTGAAVMPSAALL